MALIGDNNPYAIDVRLHNAVGHSSPLQHYTAVANDYVTSISVFGRSGAGISTIRVAIYQVSFNKPRFKLGSSHTITFSSSIVSWKTVATSGLELIAGRKYCVCMGEDAGNFSGRQQLSITGTLSYNSSIFLDDLWLHGATTHNNLSLYATVENIPPVSYPCCAQLIE